MTDPRGNSWSYAYDAQGNLREVVDPQGSATVPHLHSRLGPRLDDMVDPRGNRSDFSHDAAGNLVGIRRADGTSSSYSYGTGGGVVSGTNRRGQTVTRARDAQGRVTLKTYPDGHSIGYDYDSRGRLVRATDSETGEVALEYDDNDALTRVTYPEGRWLRFESNAAGLRTAILTSDGYELHYAYTPGLPARVPDGRQRRGAGALRVRPPRQARSPHARETAAPRSTPTIPPGWWRSSSTAIPTAPCSRSGATARRAGESHLHRVRHGDEPLRARRVGAAPDRRRRRLGRDGVSCTTPAGTAPQCRTGPARGSIRRTP